MILFKWSNEIREVQYSFKLPSEYTPPVNTPTCPTHYGFSLTQTRCPSNPPSEYPSPVNTYTHPVTHTYSFNSRVFTRSIMKIERETALGRRILELRGNTRYKRSTLGQLLHGVTLAYYAHIGVLTMDKIIYLSAATLCTNL